MSIDPVRLVEERFATKGCLALDSKVLIGLAGDVVREIEPHTEADPAALLVDFLTSFGSAVGPGPHVEADGARHPARLNAVMVGETSASRKGSSRRQIDRVFRLADPRWSSDRVVGGLASGEGLIAAVRDPEEGPPADRRLLVVEEEFARVLSVAARDGSTVSPVIRQAWDTGDLRVMTRKDPLKASGAHISIIGHITEEELRLRLNGTETANGFANRFLFVRVRRSKLLPSGGTLTDDDLGLLGRICRESLEKASTLGRIGRSTEAEDLWGQLYLRMADEASGGMLGAITARAEAQVLRLSLVYALTEASQKIEVPHLEAAWGLWRYAAESARLIFGSSLGNRELDRLLAAIREAGKDGLDGTQQRDVFGRHVSGERLESYRRELERRGLIITEEISTSGRPRLVSRATEATKATKGLEAVDSRSQPARLDEAIVQSGTHH